MTRSLAASIAALALTSVSATALSWTFTGAPLDDTDVEQLFVHPEDDSVWLATSSNALYVSLDSGESWDERLSGNIGALDFDPVHPEIVYASAGSDLYRSSNLGWDWELVHSFPALIPGTPDAPTFIDSLLASATDGWLVVGLSTTSHSARIYTSDDAGDSWEISWESPAGLHFWDIAEVPGNGHWFVCTEDSAHAIAPNVMRSANHGTSWEEISELRGVPSSGHGLNLEVHPVTEIVYFLTESTVLYRSLDLGATWRSDFDSVGFGSFLLLDELCFNRVFGGELVRGVSVGGAFLSVDGSTSFERVGLEGYSVSGLALSAGSSTLYAVAYGSGIWETGLDLVDCTQEILLFRDGFERGDTSRWSYWLGA